MIKSGNKLTLSKKWIVIFLAFTLAFTVMAKLILDVGVIRIVPAGTKNPDSGGTKVHIGSIVKNNREAYDLNLIKPEGWHTIWDTNIESYGIRNLPLEIKTRRYDVLQVTFINDPYMGEVNIETSDGSSLLDLYTPDEYDTMPVDIPFAVTETAPFTECMGIGVLLSIVTTGFLYFLANCRSAGMVAIASCVAGYIGAILLIRGGVEFGKKTDACFIAAYGFFSELTLPCLLTGQDKRSYGKFVFLTLTSAYAAVALLYKYLIKPYSSFHFGVYGCIQFILAFAFWFFCFHAVLMIIEDVILGKNFFDQKEINE